MFVNNASLLPFFSQENYYHQEVLIDMTEVMENTGNFRQMYIIGPDGSVILSTERDFLGTDLSESDLFGYASWLSL